MVVEPQNLNVDAKVENIIVLRYGPEILTEMSSLSKTKQLYNAIIIDCTLQGYLFPTEVLVDSKQIAENLLEISGALIFLKADRALALVKDSLAGQMSFQVFHNHAQLYDYSPTLTKYILTALGQATNFVDESTDLSHQILMSSVPVLTPYGMELKLSMTSHHKRNLLLARIDNYSPIQALLSKVTNLENPRCIDEAEFLERLRELEQKKLIYPLFPRIPFLASCFKNKTAFSLKDYLVASGQISIQNMDNLLMEQNGMPGKHKLPLGVLAVKHALISARQLEIATQDIAFYGQKEERESLKIGAGAGDEEKIQSLVGHLGSVDPSNLLQNLATNRESGVLSVEHKELQFRAIFETGRITHAKMGKLLGNKAVIEFASTWKQGIFVFIQRTPPADLARDTCKIGKALDKLLLDAALAGDNAEVTWKKLPKAMDSVLEKKADTKSHMENPKLEDPKEKFVIPESERGMMKKVWNALDGLHPVTGVIRNLADCTTCDVAMAIDRLLAYDLVSVPQIDLNGPLNKFQQLVKRITETIGVQRSEAFLRLSLRDTLGYSGRARVFILSKHADVGVDMAAARTAGTSLSQVVQDIEDWQVKYIEYATQELDRNVLLGIIREVHNAS